MALKTFGAKTFAALTFVAITGGQVEGEAPPTGVIFGGGYALPTPKKEYNAYANDDEEIMLIVQAFLIARM